MSLRTAFQATLGRRLLVRIWVHGVLLFIGVIATVIAARFMLSDVDEAHAIRSRPYLAVGVADRVLAQAGDRAALAREVQAAAAETPLALSVFDADGGVLASSVDPPLPAPAPGACRAHAPLPARIGWSHRRLTVGGFRDGRLVACAVIATPAPPSIPRHVAVILSMALVLAFVFVAAPLAYSIARPIERLGTLARELGAGNLAVRADSGRRDEIGDLARSFNTMAAQIQRLRAAERELLGDVSHELRTPLARIRVVLDLASDADLDRVRRYLAEVATDLGELEQMIDDIIVSARLEPGAARWDEARPPLRRRRVAVDELVRAAEVRFRTRWPARELEVHGAGPPFVVDGDPAMLRRVLDNLLDNARKYSPDDAPIAIRVERRAVDGRAGVGVEVIDRGVGIAAEDHGRVFSVFFRADRSRARTSGGVGLGLALARRIVEAHGGTIGFESAPGGGSRFWFVLALGDAVET